MQHADPHATQQEVAAFLEDPRTHGGAAVQRIDTHAAMVFLAGERAYKLKRAVRYPYLDFSTAEKRRAACEAELALNRRTAPSLYLGVTPVVRRADGTLGLGGEGLAVDWLVVMRRFAPDQLFDRRAERGLLTAETMRDLADAIAAFHAEAEPRSDGGGVEAMRAVVDENLAELRDRPDLFAPERVGRLTQRSVEALDRWGPLIEERRRAGFVRHCHGDLHLRNIVLLDDTPTLFDGIEFDESFAVIDVGYDLAFLLMDLEHRGLRALGNTVLNRYLEATEDYGGLALLPLFLSTRAAVRAKIAATMAAMEEDRGAAEGLKRDAVAYLDHALRALEPLPARLVAVGGLSGTGKSQLARAVAPGLGSAPGAVVLRSDVLRKRLFGVGEMERLPPEAYGPGTSERVYAELAERARAVLAAGHAVVADAVYAKPEERAAIEDIARGAGVRFDGVWLDAPLEQRVARVSRRRGDASDATAEVAERQESYELGAMSWARVDSGRDAGETLAATLERLA
ncbi:AAA family ATPase [Azospirillum soli]|uniref:bifunctional aminoglycoside phosphotransferase/ATP-binding protein n=1 Tax=Azospirillum soli TaxID=1304799 RepID=UPI001AE25DD6|nr:bifunctional aminoglycoside phosphotransferase/ATP-binding protein [Azospirillum soli]MBP2313789.1 aminoglycoside phosphotransferase family enzyme/predicted kinase [Azospirillum soli]